MRLVRWQQPKSGVIENVMGFARSHANQMSPLEVRQQSLIESGYAVGYRIADLADYFNCTRKRPVAHHIA